LAQSTGVAMMLSWPSFLQAAAIFAIPPASFADFHVLAFDAASADNPANGGTDSTATIPSITVDLVSFCNFIVLLLLCCFSVDFQVFLIIRLKIFRAIL
jgi:hypothetical protein